MTDLAAGKGRRRSRRLNVGKVPVGGGAPVSVQSMCITKTADINATLQQIAELAASGCDIVRVAVPDTDDAAALPAIATKSTIPVVADIHFQWKYAMAAIEAGCAGVRINPGNIKKHDKVKLIAREAGARGIPIRVGVNAGSLQKEILAKHGGPIPEALVESALFEVGILESVDFGDVKISVEEVKVGNAILGALGLRPKKLDLVACPSCGRAEVDVFSLANAVEERMGEIDAPLRVAVMGCIVNGPGEAREADIGVASGKGKGQIFRGGQVIRTVPESEIVDSLMHEAKLLAEEYKASGAASGKPEVIRR